MARASASEQTGSTASLEVRAKFTRIDFGFAVINEHDNGTDVFLLVRDARRFDLGLTLAAQIKGGKRWFREQVHNPDGNARGWWFRDDNGEHIDDWLNHGLPHLVVLHDLETDTSYWAHVAPEAVKVTGKGKKIFVPASQRVDEDSRDTLIGIAATARPAPVWEGAAWRGATSVVENDRLRYALLAPRLIAPHRNLSVDTSLSAYQAIAMVMQTRIFDLLEFEERGHLPTVADAENGKDWYWRLYAALRRRVTAGDIDHFAGIWTDGPDAAARTAAAVSAAACLMENDRPDDAIPILQKAIDQDEAGPVDHAWLSVQLARAYLEIGRVDEARSIAASVQGISRTHSSDATATAIAGAGIRLIYSAADLCEGDLAATVEASDTAVTWWRHESIGWALGETLDRTFNEWVQDGSVGYSARDDAHDELLAASLNATFVGLHSEWRALIAMLGRDTLIRLTRHSDHEQARAGLSALLRSGQANRLEKAVYRLVNDGPAAPVAELAETIHLDKLTRTTAGAALAFLKAAAVVLSDQVADNTATWILQTLDDPDAFDQRVQPSFQRTRLVEVLAALLPGCTDQLHTATINSVIKLPPLEDELSSDAWAAAIRQVRPGSWTPATARAAADAAMHYDRHLGDALLHAASPHTPTARGRLLARVAEGIPSALMAWRPISALPADIAAQAAQYLSDRLEERRLAAPTGAYSIRVIDDAEALALINRWHPHQARWESLLRFLEDPEVMTRDKQAALQCLLTSDDIDDIDEHVRDRLTGIAHAVLAEESNAYDHPFFPRREVRGTAAFILSRDSSESKMLTTLTNLVGGTTDQRRWAAQLATYRAAATRGRPASAAILGALLVLVHDKDPHVRARAAAGLAKMIATEPEHPAINAALEIAIADPGVRVPLTIAHHLAKANTRCQAAQRLLDILTAHQFKQVRDASVVTHAG